MKLTSFGCVTREVLGAVSAAKPSGVFRTGWPTNEQIQSCPVAQLGVSIESEVSAKSKFQIQHKRCGPTSGEIYQILLTRQRYVLSV